MTLDEAIKHSKEKSKNSNCNKCAAEHKQLSEWLSELKWLKRNNIKNNNNLEPNQEHKWGGYVIEYHTIPVNKNEIKK